jgi:competence protein ComEA
MTVVVVSVLLLNQPPQPADQTGLAAFSQENQASSVPEEVEESITESKTRDTEQEIQLVVVDVKGEVERPGLYTLKLESRVNDAIVAAGGFTAEANQKSVNLAQKLADEEIIYVAHKDEDISVITAPNSNVVATQTQEESQSSLVNLNTATEADLQTISGIGAKRAADIIAYREANGGFKSVDDLNNVSGIGDKTMESIRPYVTVD